MTALPYITVLVIVFSAVIYTERKRVYRELMRRVQRRFDMIAYRFIHLGATIDETRYRLEKLAKYADELNRLEGWNE